MVPEELHRLPTYAHTLQIALERVYKANARIKADSIKGNAKRKTRPIAAQQEQEQQ
jgi:hypothetical protein